MKCEHRDCDQTLIEFGDAKAATEGRRLIPCPFTTACYMKDWECDGENDCWDGSDEKNCDEKFKTQNGTCASDMFRCANGKCIPLQFICDHEDDCGDSGVISDTSKIEAARILSSDERNCQNHCTIEQFTCGNSTLCIPLAWVCDGVSDCPDRSDEKSCVKTSKCCETLLFIRTLFLLPIFDLVKKLFTKYFN